jgi:hypothetical protein
MIEEVLETCLVVIRVGERLAHRIVDRQLLADDRQQMGLDMNLAAVDQPSDADEVTLRRET